MSQHLVIRLDVSLTGAVNYAVIEDRDNSIIQCGTLKGIEELGNLSAYYSLDLIVVLPCSKFFFKQIEYPKKYNQNMKDSIPFMIESEVSSDTDDLEIVVLEAKGHKVDVMAYEKSFFDEVKKIFESRDLHPSKYTIDCFTLPFVEKRISFLDLDGELIFRNEKNSGMVMSTKLAKQYFKIGGEMPIFYCMSELPWPADKVYGLVPLPMGAIAKGALASKVTPTGLIQSSGSFIWKHPLMRPWYKVGIAVAAVMLVSYAALIMDWVQLEKKTTTLRADVKKIFKTKFPSVTNVSNPILQFKQITNQKVDTGTSEDESFVHHMADVAGSFNSKVQLQTFSYDRRQRTYRFRLIYKNLDNVEDIKKSFQTLGYESDYGGISVKNGIKTVNLVVKEAK